MATINRSSIDAEIEEQEKRLEELKKKKADNLIQTTSEIIDEWMAASDKLVEFITTIKEEGETLEQQLKEKFQEVYNKSLVVGQIFGEETAESDGISVNSLFRSIFKPKSQ